MQADIPTLQNPKDIIGASKPGLRHVPPGPLYLIGLAMDDGARKYGAFNWRKTPVAASIYRDACQRHLDSFFHGAELAEDSGIPHLAHAAACLMILLDAQQQGSLIDDRPPHNVPLDQILVEVAQVKKPAGEVGPQLDELLIDRGDVVFEVDPPAASAAPETLDPAQETESVVAEPAPAADMVNPISEQPQGGVPASSSSVAPDWTDDECRRLLRAVLGEGVTVAAIAEKLGRTEFACKYRLRLLRGTISGRTAPEWAAAYIRQVTGPAPAAEAPTLASDRAPQSKVAPAKAPAAAVTAKPAAPKPAPAKQPAAAPVADLTLPQKDLMRQLKRLDDSFTRAEDLVLAEKMIEGGKVTLVSLDLEIGIEELQKRWRTIENAALSIDPQAKLNGHRDLLAVLQHRVGVAA